MNFWHIIVVILVVVLVIVLATLLASSAVHTIGNAIVDVKLRHTRLLLEQVRLHHKLTNCDGCDENGSLL